MFRNLVSGLPKLQASNKQTLFLMFSDGSVGGCLKGLYSGVLGHGLQSERWKWEAQFGLQHKDFTLSGGQVEADTATSLDVFSAIGVSRFQLRCTWVTCVAEDSNVAGVTRLPPLRVVVRHLEFGSKCSILQGSLFMTAHAICQIEHWRSKRRAFDRLQHWKQQSTSCRRHSHRPAISLTCGHGLERHRSIRKNIFCSSSSHSHATFLLDNV